MNFLELQNDVYREIEEASGAPVMWSRDLVKRRLNEAYEDWSDETEWFERVDNIPLLAYRTYYDLRTNLPYPVLSTKRVYNMNNSAWMQAVRLRELDFHTYVQWEINTGTPMNVWPRGLFWLGVHPAETDDSKMMRVHHTAMPPRMVTDEDVPGFAEEEHVGLIDYAVSELFGLDGESELADAYWQRYVESRTDYAIEVKAQMTKDRLIVMGAGRS